MIIITGSVVLKSDQREKGIDLGKEHSARSRVEPGCISHDCYVDTEDPNRLHFFERWQDMAAVQTHFAVPESQQFVVRMRAISVRHPQIEIYNAEVVEVS